MDLIYISMEKLEIDNTSKIIGDCTFGKNVKIINSTIIDTKLGDNVTIENSHIEKAIIMDGCSVGPFARIREGSVLGENVKVGNFVEIKNSMLGARCKASHLSYIGDSILGEDVNVGCGVIFVNYDGKNKHKTIVGDRVFIGCNSNLIAPVFLEDDSFIGAGTTVTKNVGEKQLCTSRVEQINCDYKNNLYLENFMLPPKYFGTDGIRGIAYEDLNLEFVKSVGYSISKLKPNPRIIVGYDTRESSVDLLNALSQGIFVGGGEVYSCGVIPTGGICYLTKALGFDYGVVLTASHNPSKYNGIKVFDNKGYKISREIQLKIEENLTKITKKSKKKIKTVDISSYLDLLKSIGEDLSGLNIFLDLANGATNGYAQKVFYSLGAKIQVVNDVGEINKNASVLDEQLFIKNMSDYDCDLGFCFDGDGDRIMAITKNKVVLSGDHILFILTKYFSEKYAVGTIMTNIGIEKELKKQGIKLIKTDVGDCNVAKIVCSKKYAVGAERSGHVIIRKFLPSGDGLVCAMMLCKIYKSNPELFVEAENLIETKVANLTVECLDKKILSKKEVKKQIYLSQNQVKDDGSVVVRYSGTEPKVRITVQSSSLEKAQKLASGIKQAIIQSKWLK